MRAETNGVLSRRSLAAALLLAVGSVGAPAAAQSLPSSGALGHLLSNATVKSVLFVSTEIEKAILGHRAVEDALATYELQEALRKDAARLSEVLTQMSSACTNITNAEQMGTVRGVPGHYSQAQNRGHLEKADTVYRNPREAILASHARSVSTYCSSFDAQLGRCAINTVPFPAGDVLATTLLASEGSGENPSETYVAGQITAVEAYVDRIVPPHAIPAALPVSCNTDQCKAYEELRKTSLARSMAARNSLTTIAGRRVSVLDMPQIDGVIAPPAGLSGQ